MFQLSRSGEYAVRAMLYLAALPPGETASISEIAERQEIPEPFLRKIIQDLAHSELVISNRGVFGGITLARSPGQVTMLEVIEAMEGPIYLNKCLMSSYRCNLLKTCPVHGVWREAQQKLAEVLQSKSLEELAQEQRMLQASYP